MLADAGCLPWRHNKGNATARSADPDLSNELPGALIPAPLNIGNLATAVSSNYAGSDSCMWPWSGLTLLLLLSLQVFALCSAQVQQALGVMRLGIRACSHRRSGRPALKGTIAFY